MSNQLLKLKSEQEMIFKDLSSCLTAISSHVKIMILHFLSQAPHSVESLAVKLDQSIANTSMHLRKMLAENIVNVSVQGQKRFYSLPDPTLRFWIQIQDFVQGLSPHIQLPVEKSYGEINWKMNKKETKILLGQKKLILIDARPLDEITSLEVEKDLNIIRLNSGKIDEVLKKIPHSKKLLVFCRGRFCAMSADIVSKLREKGRDAYRFKYSWTEIQENFFKELK